MRVTRVVSLLVLPAVAATCLAAPAEGAARPAGPGLRPAVEAPEFEPSGTRIGAVCAKRARRRARAMRSRAQGSRATRRVRRARASSRRRCATRLRAAARRRRKARRKLSGPATGNLVIGIDGGYAGWSDSETEQRAELGAAVTRHEWIIDEPVDAQEDLVLKAAAEVHTRIHALLGGNQLGDPTHYREWVIAFIRRYGPGGGFWSEHPELDASRYAITTVELGNEPYFGEMSPSLYADTVRPALEEIQRLALPVKVVLPSRVYGGNTSWMDTLYARIPDLNSLFYAFADHPYWYGHDPAEPGPAGPFARISTLRERMNEHGAADKPIFITEYGESTADCGSECISEEAQAEHLRSMIDAVISRADWGVRMLSIFQLRDRGTHDSDRERQFGLLREDGTAKPSYSIVQSAIQQFRG